VECNCGHANKNASHHKVQLLRHGEEEMSGSHKTMFGKSKFVTVVAIEVLIKYRINSLLRADQFIC
jgi:hypothetical protein